MSLRPLVFVSGLTIGDYFLWSWSLGSNHDVIALASGLTLPPLALILVWLLVTTAAKLLSRLGRRHGLERPLIAPRASQGARARRAMTAAAAAPAAEQGSSSGTPSRKIAA